MTFISELDLDMVLLYHCAKKKVSIPSASKVTPQTDTQTDRNTDATKALPPHTRSVKIIGLDGPWNHAKAQFEAK